MIKISELTKEYYKTGEVAKFLNISSRSICNYCDNNVINNVVKNGKQRLIPKDSVIEFLNSNGVLLNDLDSIKYDAIYARVSTHKQKNSGDLDRQIQAISSFVIVNNPVNLKIFSEVASGLNDNRKQLNNLLDDVMQDKVNRIFIHHKDRLTRFGFNYLEQICHKFNTQIIVVSNEQSDKSMEEELAEDIISIIHSFSGKLYGMRSRLNKEIQKELNKD